MQKPFLHQDTWDTVRRLAAEWGEPEWKVLYVAVLSLERLARERPEVLDLFNAVEGEVHAAPPRAGDAGSHR